MGPTAVDDDWVLVNEHNIWLTSSCCDGTFLPSTVLRNVLIQRSGEIRYAINISPRKSTRELVWAHEILGEGARYLLKARVTRQYHFILRQNPPNETGEQQSDFKTKNHHSLKLLSQKGTDEQNKNWNRAERWSQSQLGRTAPSRLIQELEPTSFQIGNFKYCGYCTSKIQP